ncbi:MAG: molybdopterin-guanine dinucleotide biosynthesis protein B [candidate division Zixibacteria bacterium]|nr:molybdopterin-guanine dinucleotide biosynthesis protein B [candidate division Zixibacteria bacterium]
MHILLVVGRKKRGKTTLVEKLVPEFKKRGYKVGTIKYTTMSHQFDTPGKDSFRHTQAGAGTTLVLSPDNIALFSSDLRRKEPQELFKLFFQDYDLILGEGFKNSSFPKIEILDSSKDTEPLCSAKDNLIALVCSKKSGYSVPVFSLEQIEQLADFLDKRLKEIN